ncbi:MAG: hypothetical protein K1X39_10855 [Thermoflexales bacterium]|nr:hypothetical protein [Thermoflexales bacterium]
MLRRYFGLVLIILLTLGGNYAERARDGMWSLYQRYASPYLAPLPSGTAAPALAGKVLVIVVRDLGVERSRALGALNALRGQGADFVLAQTPPTYALPALMTLLSGASAEIHGYTGNDATGHVSPDSWLRAAQDAGLNAVVIASSRWEGIADGESVRFEPPLGTTPATADLDAVERAREALGAAVTPARLVVVELQSLTVREDGAAQERVNTAIRTLSEAAFARGGTASTAVLVISDRGTFPDGADGGGESDVAAIPLVMAGAGIRAGASGAARATAFAPTVSALVGLRMPQHAEDGLLAGALTRPPLTASASQLATFYEGWSEVVHQPRFAAEQFRGAQAGLSSGSETAYRTLVISMQASATNAREARLNLERAQRLPVVAGGLLIIVVLGLLALSAGGWRAALGALLTLGGAALFFALGRGHSLSLSVLPAGQSATFFDETTRDVAAVMGLSGVLIGALSGGLEDVLHAITAAISGLALAVLAALCVPLWYYALYGPGITWALPESGLFIGALTALTGVASTDLRVLPGNAPIPLAFVIAAVAALAYFLTRPSRSRRWTR